MLRTVIRRGDNFYMVSTSDTFDAGWETMVFPCSEAGKVTSYGELACRRYGRGDNAKADAWNGHNRMVDNFQP
jgi:hypothetical protein